MAGHVERPLHRVMRSACSRIAQEEPHLCVANESLCCGDFDMPFCSDFIMVRSSEITNQTARHENVFNYMGIWAKVLNEQTNQYDWLRTKLQYGNPAQNWCSNVFVPLVAGANSRVALTFVTTNDETLNMGNIEILVRNVGGIVESIRWDYGGMQTAPFVYPTQSTKRIMRDTDNSKITVTRTEAGNVKLVTLACSMDHPACQQGFAITATTVFEIWVCGVGKQTLINKVLFC